MSVFLSESELEVKTTLGFVLFLPSQVLSSRLSQLKYQDFTETNFVDRWRGRRLLVDWLESHLFCFHLLLFWAVHFGTFRRLPYNIWASFSHKMMERQPSITPLNATPLLKTACPHACVSFTA